jgi:hypothetical protein
MRTTNVVSLFLCITSVGSAPGASPGGALTCAVVDDKGAPIARALVLYQSVQTVSKTPDGRRILSGADTTGAAAARRRPSTTLAAGGQKEVIVNLAIP